MVLSFLDYEGIDPVESPRAAAAALSSAKDYFNKTGGKAFLFHADSVDEFDVRAEVEGVAKLLNVAGNGLGDDGRDKLLASLRREFVAAKDPCGDCAKGEKCVCTHEGCHCEKTASVKEAQDATRCGYCGNAIVYNGDDWEHMNPRDDSDCEDGPSPAGNDTAHQFGSSKTATDVPPPPAPGTGQHVTPPRSDSCTDCGGRPRWIGPNGISYCDHCRGNWDAQVSDELGGPIAWREAAVHEANKYIKPRGDKWVILQKGTGKVLSTHDSEDKAEASFRAMEMHKH